MVNLAQLMAAYGDVQGRKLFDRLSARASGAVPVAPALPAVIRPAEAAPGAASEVKDGHHMKLYCAEWQALIQWVLALPSSSRPFDVQRVLLVIVGHVGWSKDGEQPPIRLSREAIANAAGISADAAGRALGVLAQAGVIERERVPTVGVRGKGAASYRLSAHLGGKGDLREAQQRHPRPILFADLGTRQHHAAVVPFPASPSGAPAL